MQNKYIVFLLGVLCCCGVWNMGGMISMARASAIPVRGVVEGFYGTPWSQEERLAALKFMGAHQLNMYIYAPKDDPYHREKWREPYPPMEMKRMQELIATARANGVEFVFAISPGLDMDFGSVHGPQDIRYLLAKMDSLYAMGVRQFAVFFDDIKNKNGWSQAQVLNRVNREFVHKKAGMKPLFTVPTEYFSADMVNTQGVKPYTAVFADALDKDIQVLYTGPGVVCDGISQADIERVAKIYGRRMSVWWNYPVSDYMKGKLALGPVVGLDPQAGLQMAAFLMNPMEHAQLSRLSLATGADYAMDPQGYQAEASWDMAMKEQFGPMAADMRVLAEHSQRMDNSWAHTGRADAPQMRRQMDDWWMLVKNRQPCSKEQEKLQKEFKKMEQAAKNLRAELPDQLMLEAAPQIDLLQSLAEAGQTALLLVQADQAGDAGRALELARQLQIQQTALPAADKAMLSDKTVRAFLQETLDWHGQLDRQHSC